MNREKRQDLPVPPGLWAGLWVVATPIGNLADLTPRARVALEGAHGILCEDTRRTAQLLSALGIARPDEGLTRLDGHATDADIARVIERLRAGQNLALVSDAGTPAISDPGARLVRAAGEAGIRVVAVPGVSAITALLSIAGFDETAFAFRGFFPRDAKGRARELESCARSPLARVFAWYESPQRVVAALAAVADAFGDAMLVAAKELTKAHERVFRGDARAVADQVAREVEREGAIGEWCFALSAGALAQDEGDVAQAGAGNQAGFESSDWVKALECLLEAQVSASGAARQVSQRFGAPKKIVYEMALKLSGKKIPKGD